MAQLVLTFPTSITLNSLWSGLYDETDHPPTLYYTTPSTDTENVDFDISDLPAGCILTGASLSATIGSPYTGAAVRTVDSTTFYSPRDVLSKLKALNGNYASALRFVFKFKANGGTGGAGSHSSGQAYSNIKLTIEYTMPASTGTLNKTECDIGATIRLQNIVTQDASYTHKAVWQINGAGNVTQTLGANPGYTDFTLPSSWYSLIPAAVTGAGSVKLQTYSGTTLLGEKVYTFTVKVADTIKPTITGFAAVPYSDSTPAVPTEWDKHIKKRSKATFNATTAAGTGSAIKSIRIECAALGYVGTSLPYTLPTAIASAGTFTFTLTVTDNRNRVNTATVDITVLDYSPPVLSGVSFARALSDGGDANPGGTWIRGIATFTFDSCGGSNTASCKAYYRQSGSTTWLPALGETVTSATPYWMGDGNISIANTYEVRIVVSDAFSSPTVQAVIPTGVRWWDFQADRAALGRYAAGAKIFALPDDWDILHKGQTLDERFGRFRLYNNPSQLGVSMGDGTSLESIVNAMPDSSILIFMPPNTATSNISPAASRYGSIEIVRVSRYRCWASFHVSNTSDTYKIHIYDGAAGSWAQLARDGGTLEDGITMPRLRITGTTDASGTAANDVPFMIGPQTGVHLEFDGNEVMAKSNGTTPATLSLNQDGGDVNINGFKAWHKGDLKIVTGSSSLTISSAGTTVNAAIDYSSAGFTSPPVVFAIVNTTAPNLFSISTGTPSATACTLYLYRSSGTGTSTVKWIAIGN